jgi:hypothetical protein
MRGCRTFPFDFFDTKLCDTHEHELHHESYPTNVIRSRVLAPLTFPLYLQFPTLLQCYVSWRCPISQRQTLPLRKAKALRALGDGGQKLRA